MRAAIGILLAMRSGTLVVTIEAVLEMNELGKSLEEV